MWSKGFGLADVEHNGAVTPLTRFRLRSVSKVLTAAGLVRLMEACELDLDAPVQRYLPALPTKQWTVMARQRAGHSAGIRHYQSGDFSRLLKGLHTSKA
ncbi:MAG: beta-lactamase family protein [Bryobacteraceae bacterium]|nr:beta-lactamase family protein [Bryobacteraceae bacterium]